MSSYRDDMNDTAVASDELFVRLRYLSEATAFARDVVIERLRAITEDAATASAAVLDRPIALLTDEAAASDNTTGSRTHHQTVTETARAADLLRTVIAAPVLEDMATAGYVLLYRTRTAVVDAAKASDTVTTRCLAQQLVTDSARAADFMWNRMAAPLLEDVATGSDGLLYRERTVAADAAQVSGQVLARTIAKQVVTDTARATDKLALRGIYPPAEDVAIASDLLLDKVRVMVADSATASDAVLGKRKSYQTITDAARASDTIVVLARTVIDDSAIPSDEWITQLHAAVVIDAVAAASDHVLDAYLSSVPALEATGIALDSLFDRLNATQLASDTAVAEDEVLQEQLAGQAWTAHSDGWAMSRWAPLAFSELAVIDGVLYGVNSRGVYALDSSTENMACQIRTGLVDVGGDSTAYLDGSLLEYRLKGAAKLDVTQTQQGKRQTYTYSLPTKPADELTSGRFVTGRGLRSRHYEFNLRLQGTQGHINDWRLQVVPSTRRLS